MRRQNQVQMFFFLMALAGIVAVFVLALEPAEATQMAGQAALARSDFELGGDFSAQALCASGLKLDHLLGFGSICFLLLLAFGGKGAGLAVALTLGLALLVEVGQGFVATRTGQLQDLLPAALGTLVAVGLFSAKASSPRG